MEQSKHSQGVTSVKVHHQPGGQQSFNIFGGSDEPMPKSAAQLANEEKKETPAVSQAKGMDSTNVEAAYDMNGNKVNGTSVKVHAPPGGRSQITFG